MLRYFLTVILLMGTVIGLSGQAMAGPAARCGEMSKDMPAAMMDMSGMAGMSGMADCCDDVSHSGKDSTPCKDMAAACAAMANCAAVGLANGGDLPLRRDFASERSWASRTASVLVGRSIPPEPHPPSRLG